MNRVLAHMAGVTTLAAFGNLAVAVAAVVVVLAIGTVVVMVLRSNGAARRVTGGLGYDAQQGAAEQPRADSAGPGWARPSGAPGAWQSSAPDFGAPIPGGAPGGAAAAGGRGTPGGWGQSFDDPQSAQAPGGAWGPPSSPRWGESPAPTAGNAWAQPERGWNNSGAGTPSAAGDAARNQGQNPWDAPAPGNPAGADQRGWAQPWGAGPAAGGGASPWGAPEAAAPAPGGWAVPQAGAPSAPSAAPGWGTPPPATPGAPAGGAVAWGNAGSAEPASWGAPASPSGPNWGAAQATPAAAPGWGTPLNPPPSPSMPNWGQEANRAAGPAPVAPGFDAPGFGAPPMGQPFGGDLDKTHVARPAGGSSRPGAVVVRQGKEPGRVFEIRGDRLTIGRSRDSDVFLEDLAVSRLHATVFRDDSGQYIVRDENSANGTTVNGQRIGEHVLDEGDEIALGQTVLAFVRR